MSDTDKQQYTTHQKPGLESPWGRCDQTRHPGHDGLHRMDILCLSFRPESITERCGLTDAPAERNAPQVSRFEAEPDSKSIHRWVFSLEDALRAIYRTWGERCENATDLLQLVKRMKERETALEEANALLQARCDTAYRRGVAEANRQHRRRVAEYLLVSEKE